MIISPDANRLGYESKEPIPQPEKCKHCGTILYPMGLPHPLLKSTIFKWMKPERCTCKEAQKWWAKYDAEQERIRKEEEEAKARELMKKRIEKLLGNSGIKKRFINRTFEKYEVTNSNREAFLISKQYAEDFDTYSETGEGLYFAGSYGTGKTHLAVAISLYLINKGIPVICKTLIDLLGEIKKTFDDEGDIKEYEILNLYKTVDLLIIDDLGKELPTNWVLTTFYSILNERYENCKPVIVTTNYDDAGLIKRLSKRGDEKTAGAIVSRLHEICFTVEMNWADRRSQNA